MITSFTGDALSITASAAEIRGCSKYNVKRGPNQGILRVVLTNTSYYTSSEYIGILRLRRAIKSISAHSFVFDKSRAAFTHSPGTKAVRWKRAINLPVLGM